MFKFISRITVLALAVGMLSAISTPAQAAVTPTLVIKPLCDPAYASNVATSAALVLNVVPGDVIQFTSIDTRNNRCTTSLWDSSSDINGLFSTGPAAGTQTVADPLLVTISPTAAAGMYSGVFTVYKAGTPNYGSNYKFLVTATKIPITNSFDCNHLTPEPTNVYKNLEANVWIAHRISAAGCDSRYGYGGFLKGAAYYETALGVASASGFGWETYFFNSSLGLGATYSYYRTKTGQDVVFVNTPDATTSAASNIAATSVRINGTVVEYGMIIRSGSATTSTIKFCVSSTPDVDVNGALTCDISNPNAVAATTPNNGGSPAGTAVNRTQTTYADITGLTTGTSYYYQVIGTNLAGRSTYGSVLSAVPDFQRANQTVTWAPTTTALVPLNGTFTPSTSATALGSQPVTYSINGGTSDCSIANPSSQVISVTIAGTCSVIASAAQTNSYKAASATVEFTFNPRPQVGSWTIASSNNLPLSGTMSLGAGPAVLGSPNVRYQIDQAGTSSDCQLVSSFGLDVTVSTAGTCAVTAVVTETGVYSATTLSTSTTFVKNVESATWLAERSSFVPIEGIYTISAAPVFTGGSQFIYSIINPGTSGCELSPSLTLALSVSGAGTCLIRAESEGSNLWTAATVDLTITFSANSQEITWSPSVEGISSSDGKFYVDTMASATSGGEVTYQLVGGTTECSLDFTEGFVINYSRSGTCVVEASIASNGVYEAASATLTFTFTAREQNFSWATNNNALMPVDGSYVINVMPDLLEDPDYTFEIDASSSNTSSCTLSSSNPVTIVPLTAGTCAIRVTFTETALYAAGEEIFIINFAKRTPTIIWNSVLSFNVPLLETWSIPSLPSTSDDLSYAFQVVGGTASCFAAGDSVSVISAGTCVIRAVIAETEIWAEAFAELTFTFNLNTQNLTWSPITTGSLPIANSFTPSQEVSVLDNATLTYAVTGGTSNCSITDETSYQITVSIAGTCVVRVSSAATDLYESANYSVTFTFNRNIQTVFWTPNEVLVWSSAGFFIPSVEATSLGAAVITYSVVSGTSGCSIADSSSSRVTVPKAGQCVVRATAAETETHGAAWVQVTFFFAPAPQTVTFTPMPSTVIPSSGIVVVTNPATALGGATISYAVVAGSGTTSNCAVLSGAPVSISVSTPGTCLVTIAAAANDQYDSASIQTTFTFTVDPKSDVAPAEGDGNAAPKGVPSGGVSKFVATNDSSFQVAWDKKTGKLISRATGIYTGYIEAKVTFTKAGKVHTCSAVFGVLKVMPGKTPAQRAAAMKSKTFTGKQFCIDKTKLNPATLAPKGGMTPANFKKIKSMNKSASELSKEKAAAAALKNFTGQVDIQVIRYRAWPTTMINVGAHDSKGGKIPALVRNTKVTLG